ncbi:MAG: class I SAM-dependent methyltransferase [Chloroflexota bacterium]|nr:class I SAM-dependent methyltransferase [Chloroflexota bacterium]
MSSNDSEEIARFYAQTYDLSVADWPGEVDFYRELAAAARAQGRAVLEVACGTGRIALRLADDGVNIVGLDRSPAMLAIAREKSRALPAIRWVEGDMRAFDLDQTFGLVIIPGHAFQNLVTPQDQLACLESIGRHLTDDGILVVHLDHQNVDWLGGLVKDKGGVFQEAEQFQNPQTGRQVQTLRAWSYEPASQTAIAETVWQEIDEQGQVVNRRESGPVRLHCVFPFEMQHLLSLAGYEVEAIYGDFLRGALSGDSEEMIWVSSCS